MKLIIDEPYRKDEENGSAFAYRIIRDNIMRMRLLPGEVLNESLLADEMGVSRTPIREALFSLKDEKLVEIHPHRTSIVTLIDFVLVREGYFTRTVIEPKATAAACDFLDANVVATLEDILARQEEAIDSVGDRNRFHMLNQLFHQTIYKAGGMLELWNSVNAVTTHYDRLRYFEPKAKRDDFSAALKGHKVLLDAMLNAPDSVSAIARACIFNIENIEDYIVPKHRCFFQYLDV